MADTTILRSTFRLLLLLTVAVFTAVGSKNEQASLKTSSQSFPTTPRSANNTIIVTATRENETGKSSPMVEVVENVKAKDVSWDKDEDDEDEEEEELENEDEDDETDEMDESDGEVDEYEDELRGIAESHEAMSRDERRNGISSTTSLESLVSENRSFGERIMGTRNFDSREKSNEMISDESSVSNEAVPKDDDEEVAELLRYKQKDRSLVEKKVVGGIPKRGSKVKRVPTVKKELSTQKEILTANETQLSLPKALVSNVEIVNRLDDETKPETRFGGSVTSRDPNRYELVRDDTGLEEEYSDVETPGDILRKLDKRQPSELNRLRSYFLDGYNSEREQRHKLQELGIEEGVLAESLMEILTRLVEDPRLWERVHRILENVEGGISFPRESPLDSRKRAHSPDSLIEIPIAEATSDLFETPSTTKKPKKKKKKKKKKPRHRLTNATSTKRPSTTTTSTTTVTSSPAPPFLTTTAANRPATTQAQWRLVAERLFGAPWLEDHHESAASTTKVDSVKNRSGSIDEKQRVSLKALNDERQALMLQSAREYSQPRRLHYGKVNTHEKGSPGSSHDNTVKNYDSDRDTRVIDYDLSDSRSYQQRPIPLDNYDRYGHYGRQRIRDFGLGPAEQQQQQQQRQQENDYDEIFRVPEGITNRRPFARTQQFRPLGREYASTKTWQDSPYNYARPWKDKSRPSLDAITGSSGNWPWRNSPSDYKIGMPRYQQPWSPERNYWHRLGNVEEELDDIENDEDESDVPPRNWQRQQQEQSWRARHDNSARWPQIDRNVDVPSWQVHERPKIHGREILPISLEKSKNLSDLSNKEAIVKSVVKEKPILPKITMKTWNSLTSDPATWPFKLNGAKPWPKDKDGKSYNPNAELVRKLGLDKQDRLLPPNKDTNNAINKEILPQNSVKYKIAENTEIQGNNRNEIDTMVNSAKSSISWPEKLNGIDEWRIKSREENERLPQRDEAREMWQTGVDNSRKVWSDKSPVSPKISSVGAWVMPADQSTWRPYDLKHKTYGQSSEDRRVGWNDPTNSEETGGRSWPTKNELIPGSWPQKSNNDWNVVGSVYGLDKSASTSHSSTWPSKWRQFAYHKVTAAPITKTGSSSVVDGSTRPRNSYIAVSAVSPQKYPNNEWRKNEIEETQVDRSPGDSRGVTFDQDDPSSQMRKNSGVTEERWRTGQAKEKDLQRNGNDPLEHQLEELRQEPYWNHDQLREQSKKRSNVSENSSTTVVTTETSQVHVNSSQMENESLKNHVESITLTETQTQGKRNVTK